MNQGQSQLEELLLVLPTVNSLLTGTTRRLVAIERSDRRLGRSATFVKGLGYPGGFTDTSEPGHFGTKIFRH